MKKLMNYFPYFFEVLVAFSLFGCTTSKDIYRSSDTGDAYWKVEALTSEKCQCTQLYVSHFTSGHNDFRIFYTDSIVRKTIYSAPKYSPYSNVRALIATERTDFTIPFDTLDQAIFRQIEQMNVKREGIVYPVKTKKYLGYIDDPKYASK
jgi:hypothetical protein